VALNKGRSPVCTLNPLLPHLLKRPLIPTVDRPVILSPSAHSLAQVKDLMTPKSSLITAPPSFFTRPYFKSEPLSEHPHPIFKP
jgi:hypothetical protein